MEVLTSLYMHTTQDLTKKVCLSGMVMVFLLRVDEVKCSEESYKLLNIDTSHCALRVVFTRMLIYLPMKVELNILFSRLHIQSSRAIFTRIVLSCKIPLCHWIQNVFEIPRDFVYDLGVITGWRHITVNQKVFNSSKVEI